ncbi:MAG: hypothetical protein KJP07_19595, partial [Desulfatitalea sp.]|nr:hypothetical protein [Desulfatitalea sp.]
MDSSGSTTGEGGKIYGTDPRDPTGPIKPYRRWSFVAPRRVANEEIGHPWDGSGASVPGGIEPAMRYEYPDWWLFKRGDTFDLYEDYLSFARESNPAIDTINAGSLAVPGGSSETQRQVVGAYGPLGLNRPRFINPVGAGFIWRTTDPCPKHIVYLSLHFDGRQERNARGFIFLRQSSDAIDIVIEDIWSNGTEGNKVQNSAAQVTVRRSVITDTWTTGGSHVQGLFFYGERAARLRVEESIFMRNGFAYDDLNNTGWPPSGDQIYDVFNRNFYLSGECENMNSGVFDTISMVGSSGDQVRPGMKVERNFFYQGYLFMGAHGGYPDSDGPTGTIVDNVFQRFKARGTRDNRGHPGWGIGLTSGAYGVEVARNIITSAAANLTDFRWSYAIQLEPLGWYCYSHTFHYPTRNNSIHDNIFDTNTANSAFIFIDGIDPDASSCDASNPSNWVYPGVTHNTITNNFVINAGGMESEYIPFPNASGTVNDTVISDNTIYPSRTAAASAEGWPDPDRTLKTYMVSLGYPVSPTSDGLM